MKKFKGNGDKNSLMIVNNDDRGSILAEGLTFKDNQLSGIGKITINCYFVGNIVTNDLIVVGESGSILGNIEARSVVVFGNIKGNVEATETVNLRNGGVLNGDIKCGGLEIDIGSAFSGNCNMTTSKKENNILNTMEGSKEPAKRLAEE